MFEFRVLAIALGLGIIVGFQREWASKTVGIRTFPLIALLGALAGLLARDYGGWVIAGAFVALAGFIINEKRSDPEEDNSHLGMTTELAALVVFAVGVALSAGLTAQAVAVAGTVAVLLHWKSPLHTFIRTLGKQDSQAIIRLVLIGLVILPVLPDQAYGPYDVMNPHRIWLMVVLIVGISLGAYMAYKIIGPRAGTLLGGILGGLISSTATTVSYARQTKNHGDAASASALVILVASTIVFLRVGIEVIVVAPESAAEILPPLALMMLFMGVIAGLHMLVTRGRVEYPAVQEPPSDLRAAIIFGLLYALVLLGVAVGKEFFGDRGLYVVAALSGLTDMDAITLSTAQLVKQGQLEASMGWRLILVGAMANLVFKGMAVAVLSHPALTRRIGLLFGLALAGGTALLFLWPY